MSETAQYRNMLVLLPVKLIKQPQKFDRDLVLCHDKHSDGAHRHYDFNIVVWRKNVLNSSTILLIYIYYILYKILLHWSNQGGWDGRGM